MKGVLQPLLVGTSMITIGLMLILCSKPAQNKKSVSDGILFNQVGYQVNAPKKILVKSYTGKFNLIDTKDNRVVLENTVIPLGTWKHSDESYSLIDVSAIKNTGIYYLELEDGRQVKPINILPEYPDKLCSAALKSFYYNRASYNIDSVYGEKWARPAGHPDTTVYIHQSATNSTYPPGTVISSPGGWYDAGDYNKYIVNSSFTIYTLLLAYELYPHFFDTMNVSIPESANNIPDILDEIIYNVRWMLTMQEPDGGIYHKLTTLQFDDFIMPHKTTKKRYVVMKTTPATLDFSASIAACSRVLADIPELKSLTDSCNIAATKAWQWAIKNPEVFYKQPNDINTGIYGDTNLADEWLWASVEMELLRHNNECVDHNAISDFEFPFGTPSWDVVNTLGLIGICTHPEAFEIHLASSAKSHLSNLANELYSLYKNSPALTSINYFKWGSNSDVANQTMLGLIACKVLNEPKFAKMAYENINYLLGRNPTGYCFVTGFGIKSPQNIHHRPAAADNVAEPIPGFLVGGPNTVMFTDCNSSIKRSTIPALSYIDEECSYSTNEVAINWTAPLVFSLAGLADYDNQ